MIISIKEGYHRRNKRVWFTVEFSGFGDRIDEDGEVYSKSFGWGVAKYEDGYLHVDKRKFRTHECYPVSKDEYSLSVIETVLNESEVKGKVDNVLGKQK